MAFRDILGQGRVLRWLKAAISQNRLAGSYLFVGPEGVGKATVAINLAKVLNCLSPKEGDACEACISCRKINKGIHPDILFIQPQGQVIKIDQIRDIQRNLSFRPIMAKRRIIIIDQAEAMPEASANAFLKTLEEPPLDTIFILIAQDKHMLLPTITSRCQIITFSPLPSKVIEDFLKNQGFEPINAQILAQLSSGSIKYAMKLGQREIPINLFKMWSEKRVSIPEILETAHTLADKDTAELSSLLEIYQSLWRDVLMFKIGCKEFIINKEKDLETAASHWGLQKVLDIMEMIEQVKQKLKQNVQKRLILEELAFNLEADR